MNEQYPRLSFVIFSNILCISYSFEIRFFLVWSSNESYRMKVEDSRCFVMVNL